MFPCIGILGLDAYFAIGNTKFKLATFLFLALQKELAMSFLKILQIETNGDISIDRFWHLGSAIDLIFRYSAFIKYRGLPASSCVHEHFYHVEVSYYGEASFIEALATFCNMSGVRQKLHFWVFVLKLFRLISHTVCMAIYVEEYCSFGSGFKVIFAAILLYSFHSHSK